MRTFVSMSWFLRTLSSLSSFHAFLSSIDVGLRTSFSSSSSFFPHSQLRVLPPSSLSSSLEEAGKLFWHPTRILHGTTLSSYFL